MSMRVLNYNDNRIVLTFILELIPNRFIVYFNAIIERATLQGARRAAYALKRVAQVRSWYQCHGCCSKYLWRHGHGRVQAGLGFMTQSLIIQRFMIESSNPPKDLYSQYFLLYYSWNGHVTYKLLWRMKYCFVKHLN